jgi:hypothetical protein
VEAAHAAACMLSPAVRVILAICQHVPVPPPCHRSYHCMLS